MAAVAFCSGPWHDSGRTTFPLHVLFRTGNGRYSRLDAIGPGCVSGEASGLISPSSSKPQRTASQAACSSKQFSLGFVVGAEESARSRET
jgi:hypothetical protein